jgi:hypothetical protein
MKSDSSIIVIRFFSSTMWLLFDVDLETWTFVGGFNFEPPGGPWERGGGGGD